MLRNSWRNKLIAMILIFTLTFGNFALVGKTYAASILDVFSDDEGDTGSANVEFDANFVLAVESDETDSSETDGSDETTADDGSESDDSDSSSDADEDDGDSSDDSADDSSASDDVADSSDVSNSDTDDSSTSDDSDENDSSASDTDEDDDATSVEGKTTESQSGNIVEENVGKDVEADVKVDTLMINFSVKVSNSGYLKDAKIILGNGEEVNFAIDTEGTDETENLQSIEDNTIKLAQMNADSEFVLTLPISYDGNSDYVELETISKSNSIKFEGTYVDGDDEITVEKEVTLSLTWQDNRETSVESEVTKYITYTVDGETGVILQMLVTVDNTTEDDALPVKSSTVEIEVPDINGVLPETATIVANSLMATTAKDVGELEFDGDNYSYDSETNILTIKVKNEAEKVTIQNEDDELIDETEDEVKAYAVGNGTDEYLITYVYSGVSIDDVKIDSNITSTFNMYGNTKLTAEEETTYELEETIGDIVTFSSSSNTESISKGYTYLNYNNDDSKYEIEIDTKLVFNVSYNEIVTSLQYEDGANYYTTAMGLSYEQLDIYYKSMTIYKDSFDEILGEDGYINLYDSDGNLLITIDANTAVADSGNYELNFEEKIKWLRIETSSPIADGNLIISCIKAYTDTSFDKDTYKTFTGIELNGVGKAEYTYVDETVDCGSSKIDIAFEETITDAEIVLSQDSLSTLAINNGVEIKIELNNDDISSDVYGESEFLIEMPEYVESVEITDYNIVYGEGLEISEISAYEENGTIYVRIHVTGVQEELSSGIVSNGTNIILDTNIKVDLYATCTTQSFKLYYLNSEATNYVSMENGYGYSETEIEYSAPSGVVAVNSISNYNEAGETVASVKQGTVVGELDLYGDSKIATMELVVMNNEENDIEDISILGRTVFEGNTDLLTGEDLGTTLDAVMVSGINYDGDEFTIYYSTNEEATNELDDIENGWTTIVEDWSQVKSYLIVPNDSSYVLEQAEKLSFSYEFYIPGDLEHNVDLYGTFGIYYTSETDIATLEEVAVADLVGLTTGVGPELETELDVNKTEVTECEQFETTVTVANVGEVTATNVEVEIPIPEYVSYTSTETDEVETEATESVVTYVVAELEAGEEIEITSIFEVGVIESLEEDEPETIGVYAVTTADDLDTVLQTETVGVTVTDAELSVELSYIGTDFYNTLTKGDKDNFTVIIRNLTDETLYNIVVSIYFDEALEIDYVYDLDSESSSGINLGSYDSETRMFTYTIDSIASGGKEYFYLGVAIGDLEDDETSKTVEFSVSVQADGTESYTSDVFTFDIVKEDLIITQTTETETYIVEGDEIIYIFTIENNGELDVEISLEDVIPDGVVVTKISYIIDGETEEFDLYKTGSVHKSFSLASGEIAVITITAYASELDSDIEELEVTNYGIITTSSSSLTSNTITHIIQADPDKEDDSDDTENTNISDTEDDDTNDTSDANTNSDSEDTEDDDTTDTDDTNTDDDTSDTNTDDDSSDSDTDGDSTDDTSGTDTDSDSDNTGDTYDDTGSTSSSDDTNSTDDDTGTTATSETSSSSSSSSSSTGSSSVSVASSSSSTGSSEEKTYKILGTVWIDANQDGSRDTDEELVENLTVTLVDSDSGSIKQTTTTDSNGEYEFTEVSNGNYIVMIDYDTSLYTLTTYQKDGVSSNLNSDFISSDVDGEEKAISETIVISGASQSNIDLGLVENQNFDLSLTMGVTKITVQNSNETSSIEYDMSTLTKTEISQKYLSGSEVYIEYTFNVTNDGDVSGYATEIVDYIPDGMTFNSSLNEDWYTGSDGNLYTTVLSDTEIVAGETKTFTLILTKTMTDENTGRVSNTAEISDDYNIYGLEDSDSTPGNSDQDEDDFARADSIIGVGTGVIVYCLSGIAIILAIALVTLVVLKKKNRLHKGGARR